jgi:hypothetical protein
VPVSHDYDDGRFHTHNLEGTVPLRRILLIVVIGVVAAFVVAGFLLNHLEYPILLGLVVIIAYAVYVRVSSRRSI